MNYCIDFDDRLVICKGSDRAALEAYLEAHDLELCAALVSSADEICLKLSLREVNEVLAGLGETEKFACEDSASDTLWQCLVDCEARFPDLADLLAGTAPKAAPSKVPKVAPKPKPKPEPKPKPKAKRKRSSLSLDEPLFVLHAKCKSGSILSTVVVAIDEELCATVGEVAEYIMQNHVCANGELADEKYAMQKLRDLVRLGKLSTEDL